VKKDKKKIITIFAYRPKSLSSSNTLRSSNFQRYSLLIKASCVESESSYFCDSAAFNHYIYFDNSTTKTKRENISKCTPPVSPSLSCLSASLLLKTPLRAHHFRCGLLGPPAWCHELPSLHLPSVLLPIVGSIPRCFSLRMLTPTPALLRVFSRSTSMLPHQVRGSNFRTRQLCTVSLPLRTRRSTTVATLRCRVMSDDGELGRERFKVLLFSLFPWLRENRFDDTSISGSSELAASLSHQSFDSKRTRGGEEGLRRRPLSLDVPVYGTLTHSVRLQSYLKWLLVLWRDRCPL